MSFRYLQKDRRDTGSMHYASMTSQRWNSMLETPRVMRDKAQAPLAIWGAMVVNPELGEYGDPRCTGNNVDYMYALQIDVDSGCSIDRFIEDYGKYRFTLYTSPSYGTKPGDRYRVIFPLRELLYTRHLVPPVKQYLVELFPMADTTCFDRGHWQIMPVLLSKDAPYRFVRHDGERLSFAYQDFAKMASDYREDSHWRKAIAEADKDPNSNHQGALDFVQKVFDSVQEGERNKTMYNKLRWLHETVGAEYNEVLTLRPPLGMEGEMTSMIERIWYGR